MMRKQVDVFLISSGSGCGAAVDPSREIWSDKQHAVAINAFAVTRTCVEGPTISVRGFVNDVL